MISYEELNKVFDMDNPLTLEYFEICSKDTDEPKYFHKHHILPKSIWPQFRYPKWNLVKLRYKDHYRVHQILKDICVDGVSKKKMWRAYKVLAYSKKMCRYVSAVEYEELRKVCSDMMRGPNNHNYGRDFSEEHRRKIGDCRRGEKHPRYGKRPDQSIIDRLVEANQNREMTDEERAEIRARNTGQRNPFYGREHSEETISKMRESARNRKNFCYAQFDLEGTILKIWKSSKELESSGIDSSRVFAATRTKAGSKKSIYAGFVWRRMLIADAEQSLSQTQ